LLAVNINIGFDRSADMDIYHQLHRRGLTTSLRDYSAYYLGRAENYACIRGDRGPSADSLIFLFRRLWDEHHFFLAVKIAWLILWGRPEGD